LPFSTRLLSEFIQHRVALLCYWVNNVLLGAVLLAAWRCTVRSGALREGTPPELDKAIVRRILVARRSTRSARCSACGIPTPASRSSWPCS